VRVCYVYSDKKDYRFRDSNPGRADGNGTSYP
jgi:hypothetical protein